MFGYDFNHAQIIIKLQAIVKQLERLFLGMISAQIIDTLPAIVKGGRLHHWPNIIITKDLFSFVPQVQSLRPPICRVKQQTKNPLTYTWPTQSTTPLRCSKCMSQTKKAHTGCSKQGKVHNCTWIDNAGFVSLFTLLPSCKLTKITSLKLDDET